METIVAMVRSGAGISFIAKDYCIDTDKLHLIPIADALPIRLCVAWNPHYSDKNTEHFIHYIFEQTEKTQTAGTD